MKLYAQQGYGTGSDPNRIMQGLQAGFINGAIISPKDYGVARVAELLSEMESSFREADRLLDPQFYAALLAQDGDARLGKLGQDPEEYPYFERRRRNQLESEAKVVDDLRRCLEFQKGLKVNKVIAPSIVIRRSLNSIEAVIAKNFIRNARAVWNEVGDSRPLLATIALDEDAIHDKEELMAFLGDITLLDEAPDGFYLLVASPTSQIRPELINDRTLGGWMLINHVLNLNGYEVVNGFSDILTPFLCAAGGDSGATGWWSNLKVFSLDRFAPASGMGRRPVFRYLSKGLLNSVRYDELQTLRDSFPQVMNGLSSDQYYDPEYGSEPPNQNAEILQSWETIASFEETGSAINLKNCLGWVQQARENYDEIKNAPAMRLMERSNDAHLESLESGIQLFAELAEIDLG